jgi:hypothetical protein
MNTTETKPVNKHHIEINDVSHTHGDHECLVKEVKYCGWTMAFSINEANHLTLVVSNPDGPDLVMSNPEWLHDGAIGISFRVDKPRKKMTPEDREKLGEAIKEAATMFGDIINKACK